MYEYRATIIRHVDADTSHVEIDLGFDQSVRKTIRWAGIDAPERWSDAGKVSLAALNEQLPAGTTAPSA
jgi:endonuclease YncB( thermonuclease family)